MAEKKKVEIEIRYSNLRGQNDETRISLDKLTGLYINVEENMKLIELKNEIRRHQDDIDDQTAMARTEVDKVFVIDRKTALAKDLALNDGKKQAELDDQIRPILRKKATLVISAKPKLSLEAIKDAMEREKERKDGVLLTGDDFAVLSRFVDFV